jgi:hypothetical protein
MIEAIPRQDYVEKKESKRKKRLNDAKDLREQALDGMKRLNVSEIFDICLGLQMQVDKQLKAIKSAEACLRLFDMEGEFRVAAPGYVDGEEFAHNVRIAHIHAARQAREVLAEALRQA